MAAVTGELIDRLFGDDTFDSTRDMQRRMRLVIALKADLDRLAPGLVIGRIRLHIDTMQTVSADLDSAFQMAAMGRKVDPKYVKGLGDVFDIAITVSELEIEYYQAIFLGGLAGVILYFARRAPSRDVLDALAHYHRRLLELSNMLRTAKKQLVGAWVDKTIDLVQFCMPSVNLSASMVISLGALAADSLLGPDKPSASKITRTGATTLVSDKGVEELYEWSQLTKGEDKVPVNRWLKENLPKPSAEFGKMLGRVGKLNSGLDLIDKSEIEAAEKQVANLRATIKATKFEGEVIVKQLREVWIARFAAAEMQLEKALKSLLTKRDEIMDHDAAFDDTVALVHYRPHQPVRFLP